MKEDYFNSSTILSIVEQILCIRKINKSHECFKLLLLKDKLWNSQTQTLHLCNTIQLAISTGA